MEVKCRHSTNFKRIKYLFAGVLCTLFFRAAFAQKGLIEIPPITAEGIPVERSEVYVLEDDSLRLVTGKEYEDFLSHFNMSEKGLFNKSVYDLKSKKIAQLAEVEAVSYQVFNAQVSGSVTVRWYIKVGEKQAETKDGYLQTGEIKNLPVLAENMRSELTLFVNGGLGLFLDNNAFFGEGDAFTSGNPIADEGQATGGVTAWPELFLEIGAGGITQIAGSNIYAYGAISGLFSGRLGGDVYSANSTGFFDIERGYAGILWARMGKNNRGKLDVSGGSNFFQLNDGFLFSRYSASANAGERGNVYLSSRTAFQKTVLATYSNKSWTVKAFFLEPRELVKEEQSNINYTGGTVEYNDNQSVDVNISVIQRTGGKGFYRLQNGETLNKKGLWIINPKLWLTNIAGTGLFLKSEYAYETRQGMRANAWYLGGGIKKEEWKLKPSLYYRYAFMEGDDPNTDEYERFDPLLTGGLGTWVQGLNFRKVVGNGNIVSHRIELMTYPKEKLRLSLDAFLLRTDELNNIGGPVPISQLESKDLGQEYSFTAQYSISKKFLLLGVFSTAYPGEAITDNLPDSKSWQTYQISMFLFI